MRVAIYARYSSDLQDARSIGDQVALARERAGREGWRIVAEFSDAAISGSSLHNRPGLSQLLAGADAGAFDAVLTESLDRVSRDLEDMAGIYKRLSFRGVKIITLADGEVGKMHVGLKGLIAAMYLDDLAQKTKRGQAGRARAGRIPGGRSYGYDVVRDGSDDRGRRTINEAEAAIVRRIFEDYAAGASPLQIVKRLNAETVRPPRGQRWNSSALNGNPARQNGILANELYVGVIVYNRQSFVKDPNTGKRQARLNSKKEWIRAEVPELRIVPADLWTAAQARRAAAATGPQLFRHNRRPRRLLSGLLRCASCGGSYVVKTQSYFGCSTVTNSGACDNRRQVSIDEIENRVLNALRIHLLEPDVVAAAVEAYRLERERLAAARRRGEHDTRRELAELERKIARLVECDRKRRRRGGRFGAPAARARGEKNRARGNPAGERRRRRRPAPARRRAVSEQGCKPAHRPAGRPGRQRRGNRARARLDHGNPGHPDAARFRRRARGFRRSGRAAGARTGRRRW